MRFNEYDSGDLELKGEEGMGVSSERQKIDKRSCRSVIEHAYRPSVSKVSE